MSQNIFSSHTDHKDFRGDIKEILFLKEESRMVWCIVNICIHHKYQFTHTKTYNGKIHLAIFFTENFIHQLKVFLKTARFYVILPVLKVKFSRQFFLNC